MYKAGNTWRFWNKIDYPNLSRVEFRQNIRRHSAHAREDTLATLCTYLFILTFNHTHLIHHFTKTTRTPIWNRIQLQCHNRRFTFIYTVSGFKTAEPILVCIYSMHTHRLIKAILIITSTKAIQHFKAAYFSMKLYYLRK